jgi:hypothetical protein
MPEEFTSMDDVNRLLAASAEKAGKVRDDLLAVDTAVGYASGHVLAIDELYEHPPVTPPDMDVGAYKQVAQWEISKARWFTERARLASGSFVSGLFEAYRGTQHPSRLEMLGLLKGEPSNQDMQLQAIALLLATADGRIEAMGWRGQQAHIESINSILGAVQTMVRAEIAVTSLIANFVSHDRL